MRIAAVCSGTRGPGSYTLNLAKAMKARGHEVLLVSEARWRKEPYAPLFEAPSWTVAKVVPLVVSQGSVARAIESFGADIVHYQWPAGTADYFFHQLLRLSKPTIATVHVSLDSHDVFFDRFFALQYSLFLRYVKRLGGLISISEFIAAQVRRRGGMPEHRHHVVYAGVDETIFAPPPYRAPGEELRLLFVGQIMPEKGVDVLVEAAERARRVRPLTLTIIGEGTLKALLQARTRGLAWVRWVGFIANQKDIADHYAQADLTVLPTRWEEAFSLVPVESMACGTPVLATRKGGTPEIVIPGRTGFLLDECSADQLAAALVAVRGESLQDMRAPCRDFVKARHTFSSWCEAHERIYGEAVRGA
jgi:glycosyltransferase involved in cell wall biosynthesis